MTTAEQIEPVEPDSACCVLESPLDQHQATVLAAQLKALADPVRLRLFSIIATSPTGDVCACALPEEVDRSQPTVSHHLSQLVEAGLLEREQRGKWAWFRTSNSRLASIRTALGEGVEHRHVAKPSVLFLCVHNAGRSQMAAGYLRHLAGESIDVYSAGSAPAEAINAVAVQAMAEDGIDISREQPQRWTDDMARTADVIVTMGCGDDCPYHPGRRRLDWELADPAGQGIEMVRAVRDDIKARVEALITDLTPSCCSC